MAGRDASAGWRDEYAHAHTPIPDGGMTEWIGDLEPGDRVHDRDDDDDDELIIIKIHNSRADNFELQELKGSPTVAALNEEYSPSAPVVEAVYIDDLDRVGGRKDLEHLRDAVENRKLRSYSFPADRLDGGGETA